MAIKLMQDGKVIGAIGDDGSVESATGKSIAADVEEHVDPELVDIPLSDPSLRSNVMRARVAEEEAEEAEEDDESAEEFDLDLELRLLKKHNEALQMQVAQLSSQGKVAVTPEGDTLIDIRDLIPDNMDDKTDEFGVARTLKNLVKAVKMQSERISRIDQFNAYNEYMRHVENAKNEYKEIFADKKIGKIANKLLDAELRTNSAQPLDVVMANVIKEMRDMGLVGKSKKTLKKVVDTKKRVPGVIRTREGTSPAVTIRKPKNIREASEAYGAWRAARRRAATEGR